MAREQDGGRDIRREDSRREALFHDLPSVTNRSFGPVPIGDSFGYPGQGGYGEDLRWDQPESQGRPRSYRGVGPRDRSRSDERIQEDLHELLTGDDGIDATAVIVAVSDGVVTLNGWVPERRMKHMAEELAANCRGVREVENRIQVGGDPADFGAAGPVRSGNDAVHGRQQGSGFSSSERTEFSDRAIGTVRAQGVADDVPVGRGGDAQAGDGSRDG
jgi:hypothetical protein